jgi:uncharacterized protein (DUF58 family)
MTARGFPLVSPTTNLVGLLFILVAMWYAASSQNNAAAYLLMFALASVFLISIPHTLLNLGGLKATAESVKPTFAGQEVSLAFEIMNHSRATGGSRIHRRHPGRQSGTGDPSIFRAESRRT